MNLDRAIEAVEEVLMSGKENARIAVEAAAPYIASDPTSWIDIHNRAEDWKDRAERAEAQVERLKEQCMALYEELEGVSEGRVTKARSLADQLAEALLATEHWKDNDVQAAALAAWEEARRDHSH